MRDHNRINSKVMKQALQEESVGEGHEHFDLDQQSSHDIQSRSSRCIRFTRLCRPTRDETRRLLKRIYKALLRQTVPYVADFPSTLVHLVLGLGLVLSANPGRRGSRL